MTKDAPTEKTVTYKGEFVSESVAVFTSAGLCASIDDLLKCGQLNYEQYQQMTEQIEIYQIKNGIHQCYIFYPLGTHRKERAKLAKKFADECAKQENTPRTSPPPDFVRLWDFCFISIILLLISMYK